MAYGGVGINVPPLDECWFIQSETNTVGQLLVVNSNTYVVLAFENPDGTGIIKERCKKTCCVEDEAVENEDGCRIFEPLTEKIIAFEIVGNDHRYWMDAAEFMPWLGGSPREPGKQ